MASRAFIFEASGLWAPTQSRLNGRTIDAMLMLAAALLMRCWWFGNPVVQVDEQFYLLVGDRLLHGATPFIDIWDRKPIGLFLIYAAIRLLGGSGVLEYQVVGAGCAALAAFLIVCMARLYASETAARLSGLAALIWFIVFDGEGGQSPIFYNPIVAGAALLTLSAYRSGDPKRIGWAGTGAMALIGLAIQVKYTAMFEGMGFGLILLWTGWRERIRLPKLAALALAWMALAVVPTAFAFALYTYWGAGDAFAFANFLSIGQRAAASDKVLAKRLGTILLQALPLIIAAVAARHGRWDRDGLRVRRFMLAWLAAAVVGLLSIGAYYSHYALPLVVPLSIAAAPAFDRMAHWRGRMWRPAVAVLLIGTALATAFALIRLHKRGDGREVRAVASAIESQPKGCLFVFDGEPILYQMTNACFVSRYVFPSHLNDSKEAKAIGVDPVQEIRRVMAQRPATIVTSDRPSKGGNPAAWALMREQLAGRYTLVAAVRVAHRVRLVYRRIA